MAQDNIPINDIQLVTQYALIRNSTVVYIVEQTDVLLIQGEANSKLAVINVFNPSKLSIKRYKESNNLEDLEKDYKNVKYTINPPVNPDIAKSPLSEKAHKFGVLDKLLKKHKIMRHVYSKPLYTTLLVNGTDSFTGNWGLGFADYAPSKASLVENKLVAPKLVETGLFVGLDSMSFIKTYIPSKELKQSIVDGLSDYVQLLVD